MIVKNGEKRDLVEEHVNSWISQGVSQIECARRVIDLFVVSVLLDAGAGSKWKYIDDKTGLELKRTEGLGIASLRMYEDGYFSSDPENPFRVDYFLMKGSDNERVSVCSLWEVISIGLLDVWPKAGAELSGKSLGDAWVCKLLEKKGVSCDGVSPSGIVPFHKLSMWLTWSLTEVLSRVGSIEVLDLAMLTGLPEYRNGGLLVDMGVIGFKSDFENKFKGKVVVQGEDNTPLYEVDSEIIVQWRCLTIVVLDKLHDIMTETLGVDKNTFTLSMLLEGGTWKVNIFLVC
ncbi:Protein urg3 [Zancudomyces culisetae]|uniref:Protein urg3 n=1 Tax=Zancudomyces culisetae TaxID=1213189 RepID=A0A1R1PVF8_ZANCU|nr:Protein urg3 [Zancudomyces culisetae]|eukprot:OMH84924.1 Protein urg3 [Zancudomyces culisetae]